MNKFKTFLIFILVLALWASFFASLKYFLWMDLSHSVKPDLQSIAWYLSLWWIAAYILGGAFASTFLKKYYIFILSSLCLLFLSIWFFNLFNFKYVFAFSITSIWFLYWLWNVVKSVILAIEIKKTGFSETLVNAISWITFVVFIIIWSILWSILFENFHHNWYLIIMGILFFISVLAFFLDYENIKFKTLIENWWENYIFERKNSLIQSIKSYIPDLKYIIKNYLFIIVTSSFLWTISTVVSQVAIEFSSLELKVEASKATWLLLYSAVWAILWNILSVKMNKKRWLFFTIFNILFALTIISFPFLWTSFLNFTILAFILGLFFWICSNLTDSYLLKRFWDENKKEYWASTAWLIFSFILFIMMFSSSFVLKEFWFTFLMISLWIISLIIWWTFWIRNLITKK